MTGTIKFKDAPAGSVVHFPSSAIYFLKVYDVNDEEYGVDMAKGRMYSSKVLRETYDGDECFLVSNDLNELFYGEDVGD